MESFLESLNLINFEKLDYEYTVESLIIDIDKLNTDQISERDVKIKKIEKEKSKADKKKDTNKSSNKNKQKKKKSETETDMNVSKQSHNMSIFIVPNVKKNTNYDLQLSQLDKLNKSKIKSVKKNDFDKIKKILNANNISMNINKASKAIQEMKAKETKNKQMQQQSQRTKEKRINNELENIENQNINAYNSNKASNNNIFTSTVTDFIENEEIIDTTNPENQVANSDLVLNNEEKIDKDKIQSDKEYKADKNQKGSAQQENKKNINKNTKGKKGDKEPIKEKETKKEDISTQKQAVQANKESINKQFEKEKNAGQNTQSKRVDDFIKNLKEKKLAKATTSQPESKQYLKQSFYDQNKYLFILDPTQRLRMRDPNGTLSKEIIIQFFELVNSIFSKFDFANENESEIDYIKQNIKEYNILVDNLMEVCENKNDVELTLFTANQYLNNVKKIYEKFSDFIHANFSLVKNLFFNCLYSVLKYFANLLDDNNNLKATTDDYKKIYNSAIKLLDSINSYLNFFCEENEKNLNKHVELIEKNNILNKDNNENNYDINVANYLNCFGKKNLNEYNFKEDENLNFYLLTKVILFAAVKNIVTIKKAFDSFCSKQTDETNAADSNQKINLNSFFLLGNTTNDKNQIGFGKLINLFTNSLCNLKSNQIQSENKKDSEVKNEEISNEVIEIETKKRSKKSKNIANSSSSSIDYAVFSQYLSCLKFFTKLNLSFETQKNKIQNLMITVSKLIVSLLNEIKAIFLSNFANEFYLAINRMIQIYIQNFKELYETNESSYNEISDLINLALDESHQLSGIMPFSLNNKNFDYENTSKKIFENFDFISLDLNYFLDDLARNYLQITIKYLKIAEKGLKMFLFKSEKNRISSIKSENDFHVLTFLEFFNKILICIINLKSQNLKPIYYKILSKSLENYLPSSNSSLKTINTNIININENSELLVQYILCDIRNFIKDNLSNSTSKSILKNLKNIRETIHFYSNFEAIKKGAIEFINNPCLFEEENKNDKDINIKSNKFLENSLCILMLLNFFDFNNSSRKEENSDVRLFRDYLEKNKKQGNNTSFDYIAKFDKKLCLYYLNNYIDSEIKNLETVKSLIDSMENETKKNQYESILDNLKNTLFQSEKMENEKIFYQTIFNELKAFDKVISSSIENYTSTNLSLANEHNKEIQSTILLIKSFITNLLNELKNNRMNLLKEKDILIKNILNEKINLIESLIVYFINKKDILQQVFPDTNNLKATETSYETCEFYDEILSMISSDDFSQDKNIEKNIKLKFDIMHEIKVNNEKLISKAITLKQSNKLYPNKIKTKSDLFEYLIQILKLETLLKESEQAEKIKEEINLKNKKIIQEDILIESESDTNENTNQSNQEIEKINVIENLEKINNQLSINNNNIPEAVSAQSSTLEAYKSQPKTIDNYSSFSNASFQTENQMQGDKTLKEEETIANLDLILKLFIEYFDVVTNELTKGIEHKFQSKLTSKEKETSQQANSSNNSIILEKALFNLVNYLESITIILKNNTFFKSFVKNLDLLEIFLKKFLNIKDLCTEINKKLSNNYKSKQNSETKILDYNINFILDSIALNELTDKLIFLASDALKNKFKHYLIYVFGEAELYKHLMVKDIQSIQSVSFEMEEFYKKSIFEQSKINGFLKRIQDEDNDYLEDVMHEIYSKEAIKYLEYPEEVIDMLSNINEAVQNDFKISTKDFYNCIFPYFYLWKTIMSKIEYGFKLFTSDKKYVEDLDNYKMLLKFNINYFERNTKLYNTFCLVVVSLLHILDEDRHLIEKKGNLLNFENFDEAELLSLGDKMDNKILFEFILNLLYKFVKIFPSLVKYYYDQLQGRLKSVFRSLITNMILPKMLTHLKTRIDSFKVKKLFSFLLYKLSKK